MDYKHKYCKYKEKYLSLKSELKGGTTSLSYQKQNDLQDCRRQLNQKDEIIYNMQKKLSELGQKPSFHLEQEQSLHLDQELSDIQFLSTPQKSLKANLFTNPSSSYGLKFNPDNIIPMWDDFGFKITDMAEEFIQLGICNNQVDFSKKILLPVLKSVGSLIKTEMINADAQIDSSSKVINQEPFITQFRSGNPPEYQNVLQTFFDNKSPISFSPEIQTSLRTLSTEIYNELFRFIKEFADLLFQIRLSESTMSLSTVNLGNEKIIYDGKNAKLISNTGKRRPEPVRGTSLPVIFPGLVHLGKKGKIIVDIVPIVAK